VERLNTDGADKHGLRQALKTGEDLVSQKKPMPYPETKKDTRFDPKNPCRTSDASGKDEIPP
jgi:hypothetical protein